MSHFRRINYSVSGAVVLTALATLFYRDGGDFILLPGLMAEMFLDVALMLVSTKDDWYSVPAGTYAALNVAAYSVPVYFWSWAYAKIRDGLRDA